MMRMTQNHYPEWTPRWMYHHLSEKEAYQFLGYWCEISFEDCHVDGEIVEITPDHITVMRDNEGPITLALNSIGSIHGYDL